LAPVHGPADRLAHPDVLQRPAARVDVEEVVAETGAPVAGQRLLVLQEVEVLVVLEEGVVDLARAERRDDIRLVRDDPEDDLVHVGQPLLEVVRVALEDHLLLDLPVLQHEGARAEGGRVEVAVLLDPGLAEDEAPEAAERREEPREGLLRQELHPVAPRGLDAVHRDEVRLPGDFSKSRSKVNLTSAEVSSWPSWKRTPSRSLKVHVSPSGLICQDSASSGTGVISASK